jgi:hypothetical protein
MPEAIPAKNPTPVRAFHLEFGASSEHREVMRSTSEQARKPHQERHGTRDDFDQQPGEQQLRGNGDWHFPTVGRVDARMARRMEQKDEMMRDDSSATAAEAVSGRGDGTKLGYGTLADAAPILGQTRGRR